MKDWEQELLKVEWKVELCHTGESCWCRIIVPKIPVFYREEEMTICDAGSISKEVAEHLVKLHNNSL
jgi:hypothetical protein